MKTFLTDFLFSNQEEIITNLKNGMKEYDSNKKTCKENELDFILEVIYNRFLKEVTTPEEMEKPISLSRMIALTHRFKTEGRNCIKKHIDDIDIKEKLLDELERIVDDTQILMTEKYEKNEKIYLNFDKVSQVGNSLVIVLSNNNVIYANEIAKKVLNIKEEEIGKLDLNEIFCEISCFNSKENNNDEWIYEGKVKRAEDEKWIEFRKSSNILYEIDMKLFYGHDITERKKIELKLKESEEKYRVLLELMPDPLYVYDNEGIQYANSAAVEMFGYRYPEEIYGKKVTQLIKILPEYESNYQQKIDMLKRTGKMIGLETKCMRRSDESIVEIETTAVAYEIRGNKFVINISRNILEKNRIRLLKEGVREKTLKLLEAKKYDELKNEFLANISHEFKTPINIIMTAIKLIDTLSEREELSKENLERYSYLSKQNCYRLIKLVDNILDMTKIDAGHMELNLQKSNVIEFTEKVSDSVREFLESKDITLIFDTDQEEVDLIFDMAILERILLNLLSNSAKYTNPKGMIQVIVENTDENVYIHVKDDGIGVPVDKQKVIFDRFVQVDKTLTRNKEGSGIGLALVKELVELHRGTVELYSIDGNGSVFTISIPKNNNEIFKIYERNKYINRKSRTLIESIDIQFSDIYSQW